MRGDRLLVGAVGALLALVLAGCGNDASAQFNGTTLDQPYRVPDVALTDTGGGDFSLAEDTDKRLTLVFFGYVRCPDICPAVLNRLASALTRIDDQEREQVEVVLVSSDPAYDTPQRLRDYLDAVDPSFEGLTGDLADIEEVAGALAVGLDPKDPGAHTTYVYGLDVADEVPVYWSQDTTPAQYASDISSLLKEA